MILDRILKALKDFKTRKLNAVQVEVSTRCQLNCMMCPKSIFRGEWIHEDMKMEVFERIPFERFRYAHLQGWGEPLLNRRIEEMIALSSKFCEVGLTTNGMLVEKHVDALKKLDLIAFSIASPVKDINARVRGSNVDEIARNMRELAGDVKVVVNTIMLRHTVEYLPQLVRFAAENGAEEVIANNLDYIPASNLVCMEIFDKRIENFERVVAEAEAVARECGIKLVVRNTRTEEALVCAENPIKNCLITFDGFVAPCVYLHLPIRSRRIRRYFKGREIEVEKVYFGNLREKGFDDIWEDEEYSKFRGIFRSRLLSQYDFTIGNAGDKIPEPPAACRSCYKILSV